MDQESQRKNNIWLTTTIITVAGAIIVAVINVIGNANVEKMRQEAELTRVALVSSVTPSGTNVPTNISTPQIAITPTDTPTPQIAIVDKWKQKGTIGETIWEFTRTGTLIHSWSGLYILQDNKIYTYKFVDANHIEISSTPIAILAYKIQFEFLSNDEIRLSANLLSANIVGLSGNIVLQRVK